MQAVARDLDASGVRYALIGGFAMALRGVQRATIDLDFILMLEDLEQADAVLVGNGYQLAYRSDNVSHYTADDAELGRVDLLHAFRKPSLGMLQRAERIEVVEGLSLPVVQVEDIIGLKIQALTNDPARASQDWHDIQSILEVSGQMERPVDWDLLQDYLGLFGQVEKIAQLKDWYGTSE